MQNLPKIWSGGEVHKYASSLYNSIIVFLLPKKSPYIYRPVIQSCVDLWTSQLQHDMRVICKYICVNSLVKKKLNYCTYMQHKLEKTHWQKFLSWPVEDIIESTRYAKIPHPHLEVGPDSAFRIPKILDWRCVYNLCLDCGVEKNIIVLSCKILAKDINEISVMEWLLAKREGVKKSGK